jgi:membrane protein DedA with SNARE-associated domain
MIEIDAIVNFVAEYRYWAIFALAFAEGPVVSIVLGFLVSLGTFELAPTVLALVAGDLIPDTAYYYFGRLGNGSKLFKHYSKKPGFVSNNMEMFRGLWQHHPQKTMFLAKLAYGLSTPFLISAGLVHMKLRRFLRLSLPVTFFQYGILFSVGYIFGDSYNRFIKYIAYGEYILAGLGVILITGYVYSMRYARKSIIKLEKEEGLVQ